MSTENLKVVISGDASSLDKASAQAKKAMDEVSLSAAEWDKRARELNIQTNYTRRAYSDMGTSAVQAARKVEQTAVQVQEASNAMRSMSKISSSATNSLFALGGIVQDAPYGFRAIANNITFFTQEMAYSAKAAGGFGAAIKAIGSAFLGPAGIIFAISGIVSLLDVFFSSSSKAATGADDAADGIKTLSDAMLDGAKNAQSELVKLNLLYSAATNTAKSTSERAAAVAELQSKYPSYLGNISKETILAGRAGDAYDKLKDKILETARARAAEKGIEANASKQLDIEGKKVKLQAQLTQLQAQQAKAAANAQATQGLNALSATGGISAGTIEGLGSKINKVKDQIADLDKQYQQIGKDSQRLKDAINVTDIIDKPKPGGAGTGGNLKTIADVLADLKTKFQAVDTLAKGLGQSQEQIATEKIKLLYEYVQKIADVGGPGAVKAIQQLVDESNKIGAKGFLPTLTGGRVGVNAPAGITGNPGVPTFINPNGAPSLNTNNAKVAKAQAQAYSDAMRPLIQQGRQLENIFNNVFSTIANGGNAFQALAQAIEGLIVKLAAAAAAAAILTVLTGGSFAAASSVAGSFKSIFSGLSGIPKLATGGFVQGPQLAVIGDAPGGEWVLNQRQISAILNGGGMGSNVQVTGTLKAQGSELIAVITQAGKQNARRNG